MTIGSEFEMIDTITTGVQKVLETKAAISVDENLFDLGLNSLKTIALIVELEVAFDIVIDDEDLYLENYSTIQKITDCITNIKNR
jgi:acyl carrier protein